MDMCVGSGKLEVHVAGEYERVTEYRNAGEKIDVFHPSS